MLGCAPASTVNMVKASNHMKLQMLFDLFVMLYLLALMGDRFDNYRADHYTTKSLKPASVTVKGMRMMCSKVHRFFQLTTFIKGLALCVAVSLVTFGLTGCTKKVDDTDTTINIPLRANVKGLDPINANDLYSSMVIQNIYEGLLDYHYLKRPYELKPLLAEEMPTVSPDGLTYTFKIRKGVRFHDNPAFPDGKGREITAEDFIYSWKRLADPRNASEGYWIFEDKIKGLTEWVNAIKNKTGDFDAPIEGLQAPDKHTLVIKLTQPYYQLQYVLAMPFAVVVPKEAVEKYGAEFLNNPVGTGPFMLEKPSDWIRNSKITLKRNPNWRGETYPTEGEPGDKEAGLLEDAGKPLQIADQLVFIELTEDQPRWQNFMKGNLEWVEIPNDNFDSAVKNDKIVPELAAKGIKLQISSAIEVVYTAFNMNDPILGKNKDLRRAFALASNIPVRIQRFYNGRALQAQGPIPPGLDGYDPDFKNPWGQFDREKAKEYLAKAGFPEGKGLPEFTYETLADSKSRQITEFEVQNWAAMGIKMKISTNTWPQFQEKIKNGQAQIFGLAWGADYPDAQNFLQLFYSKNVSPGPNDSGYKNPEYDKLYEASLKLPPGKERTELYKKMRDILIEDMPWIFGLHRLNYRLTHGWLRNFKYNEMTYGIYKYVRVDPKKRAELKPKL